MSEGKVKKLRKKGPPKYTEVSAEVGTLIERRPDLLRKLGWDGTAEDVVNILQLLPEDEIADLLDKSSPPYEKSTDQSVFDYDLRPGSPARDFRNRPGSSADIPLKQRSIDNEYRNSYPRDVAESVIRWADDAEDARKTRLRALQEHKRRGPSRDEDK